MFVREAARRSKSRSVVIMGPPSANSVSEDIGIAAKKMRVDSKGSPDGGVAGVAASARAEWLATVNALEIRRKEHR